MPPGGSPSALPAPTLIGFSIAHTAVGVVSAMVIGSMMADVAEDVELKTGRRSEGLLFSANAFIAKATSGVGLFASGAVLSCIVRLPRPRPAAPCGPGRARQTGR